MMEKQIVGHQKEKQKKVPVSAILEKKIKKKTCKSNITLLQVDKVEKLLESSLVLFKSIQFRNIYFLM